MVVFGFTLNISNGSIANFLHSQLWLNQIFKI